VTDRRTDGRTELRWLRRATAVAAVARKNTDSTLQQAQMLQKKTNGCVPADGDVEAGQAVYEVSRSRGHLHMNFSKL